MKVMTIGFTKTTAERFFSRVCSANAKRVIDVRLKNSSQLAGFAKSDDLRYFLKHLTGADYVHEPLLAPTDDMLARYKKGGGSWHAYEDEFLGLMAKRGIEDRLPVELFDYACLLCSEEATSLPSESRM